MPAKCTHTRRTSLMFLTASFALSSAPALSGGGGGREQDPFGSGAPLRDPVLQESYSQAEFTKLSKREIEFLHINRGRVKTRGPFVKVDGFSKNMVEWLIAMLYFDRPSARRLIRDMDKIKDKAKRKARLAQEITKTQTRITRLKAARERAKNRGNQHAINEATAQLDEANAYLEGVETWSKFTHEGQR